MDTMMFTLMAKFVSPIGLIVVCALTYKIEKVKWLFIPVLVALLVEFLTMLKAGSDITIIPLLFSVIAASVQTAIAYKVFSKGRTIRAAKKKKEAAAAKRLTSFNKYSRDNYDESESS